MAKADQVIKEGAAPFLEPGEEVLVAVVAAPRGHTQSIAGAKGLGAKQKGRQVEAADQAGLRVEAPMALALTPRRLLALKIGTPIGPGMGGKVKELLSSVPIADVDSIEVKRLLLGSRIILTVRGVPVKLEAGAGARTKDLAEAFRSLRGG